MEEQNLSPQSPENPNGGTQEEKQSETTLEIRLVVDPKTNQLMQIQASEELQHPLTKATLLFQALLDTQVRLAMDVTLNEVPKFLAQLRQAAQANREVDQAVRNTLKGR